MKLVSFKKILYLVGFSGVNCQGGSTGPCKNNQCKNGATCFATSKTDYSCACVSGFYG